MQKTFRGIFRLIIGSPGNYSELGVNSRKSDLKLRTKKKGGGEMAENSRTAHCKEYRIYNSGNPQNNEKVKGKQ